VVQANTLTATRVGDEVKLRWTTPSHTTDKLLIVGQITAEICRETPLGTMGAQAKTIEPLATQPCTPVVVRVRVTPGASEAVDPLPASLTSGVSGLLVYRVQLRNQAGRTAGASPPVFAASGPAPPPVEGLTVTATKAGALLEWKKRAAGDEEGGTKGMEGLEVDRTTLEPVAETNSGSASGRSSALPGAPKQPVEARLRVETDRGGTIDRSAQIGHSYRYTVERVRTVVVGGQTLELRSLPSAALTVAMQDVFPPEPPAGLVAAPGAAGEEVENPTSQNRDGGHPAIDLSWEPDMEPRMAGYRVYRRDMGRDMDGPAPDAWATLGAELVPTAAYRDATVVAGHRYAYRVTAVSSAGKESAPSSEVVETAPGP
jgi:hypothetical protein